MTAVDERPGTATGPTVRSTARSARGPVLVGLGLLLVGGLTVLMVAVTVYGVLRGDPET